MDRGRRLVCRHGQNRMHGLPHGRESGMLFFLYLPRPHTTAHCPTQISHLIYLVIFPIVECEIGRRSNLNHAASQKSLISGSGCCSLGFLVALGIGQFLPAGRTIDHLHQRLRAKRSSIEKKNTSVSRSRSKNEGIFPRTRRNHLSFIQY